MSGETATDAGALDDFADYELVEVLSCYAESKTAALHARHRRSNAAAVVLLEKEPFDADAAERWLAGLEPRAAVMRNDIYSVCRAAPPQDMERVRATLISPASESHVEKYRSQRVHMVAETAQAYRTVTEPYVAELAVDDKLKWVYNVLNRRAETERIVYADGRADTGFVLAADMKWDGRNVHSLYMQVVVNRRGIRTLRDVRAEHLPLLENIQNTVPRAVADRYAVAASQLRLYVHYPPSYYHLHVHVVNAGHCPPGVAQSAGQAVLLQDVIESVRADGEHYSKRTVHYGLKANHPLYARMIEAGLAAAGK